MNKIGVSGAICDTICSSTTESAPKLDTSATLPSAGSASAPVSILPARKPPWRAFSVSTRALASSGMGLLLRIKGGLEGRRPQPAKGLQEALIRPAAPRQIGTHQPLD